MVDFVERAQAVFTPNYRPAPIVLERGEGVYVYDSDGRRYLDLIGGIAVSALGHRHPKMVAAIADQAYKILHTSNLFLNEPSIQLAERLVATGGGERVYFCNSGAEANEAAIKLARRYAWDRGEKTRNEIITFEGSFHGRTLGALAATAQPKYHEGFGPMPGGFKYVAYGDEKALEAAASGSTAAIMLEPIQGESGVRTPPPGFLAACRRAADRVGAVLIFDEVQVGVGRTGQMFGHQAEAVRPDILTLAKGIGGGLPLGALLSSSKVASALTFGTHASTFGGNPVATRAGCVVLDALAEPGFLERVAEVGASFAEALRTLNVFGIVRGRGLLIGAELAPGVKFEAKAVVDACRGKGLLVHTAGPRVVRFAPPLILEQSHVDEALAGITAALRELKI